MIHTKLHIGLLALCVLLFAGCNHYTEEFDGPNLNDRFGPFAFTEDLAPSSATFDFSRTETAFFTAAFTKNISWVLRITGQESGAVKLIEGFSNRLEQDNATWNGTTTELPFFREEVCTVELIIPGEDSLTQTTQIEITDSRVYEGAVAIDFESEPGASLFIGNFEFELTARAGIQDDIPAGQGSRYFLFEGNDAVVANNFAGLFRVFPSINGQTYFQMPSTIPESSFFNFMIYGDGAPNTIAVIQFFTDSNQDGTFTDGVDDSFELGAFPIEHGGWKLFSEPMESAGMTQAQLQEIVAIQVLLISGIQGNAELVRFGIDYLSFTQDQPLQP